MNAKTAASIILAISLVACSTVPRDNFRRIEISTYDPDAIIEAAPSQGKAAAAGAAVGATGGLFYSALLSLACGPFFAACFAGAAPVVVGATAVGGGVAGAVSVSREDLAELKDFMTPAPGPGQLNQELASAVAALLKPSQIAETGSGDARLILGIARIDIEPSTGKVYLRAAAHARFDWKLDRDEPEHAEKSYFCMTSEKSPGDKPGSIEELVRSELDFCIGNLAQQIYGALTKPPDSDPAGFSEWPD